MWFKNLAVFQLNEAFPGAETLAERLAGEPFRPCLSQQLLSDGWVAPLGRKATDLVHAVNDCALFCLQTEEKVLPAAVVKELLGDKIEQIEEREQRNVARREKERLRDELMLELLPRAFSRRRRGYAYVDRRMGWLVIDSASPKGIEEITTRLRETLGGPTLGGLPLALPQVVSAPAAVLTAWLAGSGSPGPAWELEDECELRDAEGVVRCKGQDLTSDEVRNHITAGKQVTRLGFSWNQRVSLLLSDDLLVRRLRFLDLVQEQLDRSDSPEQLFDAEFALMSGELREFLPQLFGMFGGLAKAKAAA